MGREEAISKLENLIYEASSLKSTIERYVNRLSTMKYHITNNHALWEDQNYVDSSSKMMRDLDRKIEKLSISIRDNGVDRE